MVNVSELVQNTIDGKENPLKAYAVLKELQKQIVRGIAEVEEMALEEASKYGEKTFEALNYKFELREGSRRYVFKGIEKWDTLNQQLKDVEAECKQAAMAYEKGKQVVDENGELIPVPEVKFSKSSIVVKSI